jgi:peptide/nickel transport system ATP-binding protein
MALLDVQNVSVAYKLPGREILACDDVSLQVEEQGALGIVGESGSGKSTLAMAVLGLLPGDTARIEGKIWFEGQNLVGLPSEEYAKLRWKKLSAVFQKQMNSLSPVHRVGRQFSAIRRVHAPKTTNAQCRKLACELFEKIGLAPRVYDMYPHELSGGMTQRVGIAFSLMFSPALVILDEATTALDVVTETQVLKETVRLRGVWKMACVIITHNMSVVASTCKTVAVMYAGRVMESGPVEKVLVRPGHPYTQGLLKSFPSFWGERELLCGIPGALPDLSLEATGCIFAPRCPLADERCRRERPTNKELAPSWVAACFKV